MFGGRSHKIRCIFGDIYWKATTNIDLERSQAVIENHDQVLHLNVIWCRVRADAKFLMVNWREEDISREVSQDQVYLWRYCLYGNKKPDLETSWAVIEKKI